MTTAVDASSTTSVRTPSPYRLSFVRVLRSEWLKLATLRSTWWSIGIVALLTVGIALLIAQAVNVPGFGGIQVVVAPVQFTMLMAGILGVIAVTGEYSTGMIRATLAAEPARGAVLAAKSIVVAVLMFVSSLAIFVLAALATAPILAGKDIAIDWAEPSASWLPLLGASLSMAVFALIGTGLGFVLRNGAGAIAATVGLLFVLPIIVSIFPDEDGAWGWIHDLGDFLPMAASQGVIMPDAPFGPDPTASLIALGGWVAVSMLAAWASLRTRDA